MSSIAAHDDASNKTGQKSIWLPAECWVDTLKLLSRRQLLRSVQPACRRLHAISELHVPSLHIVRHFGQFLDGLVQNQPEANWQNAELEASKAELAQHFRLQGNVQFTVEPHMEESQEAQKRRRWAQMCVLRHSPDLFHGCKLHLPFLDSIASGEFASDYQAYLSLLAPARPFSIQVVHAVWSHPELHADVLLRESVMLACPRLAFYSQNSENMPSAEIFCHWLHYMPLKEKDEDPTSAQTRIFIHLTHPLLPSTGAEIIERCKKLLLQAESTSDQRSFLLNFHLLIEDTLPLFKLENRSSGEVLHLEQWPERRAPWTIYRSRRCTAAELANAENFYRDTFRGQTLTLSGSSDGQRTRGAHFEN